MKTMGRTAGICLALAMPLCGAGQQPTFRYQPPAAPSFEKLPLPTLKAVSPDGQATVVEGIVARVNDRVITRSDLEKEQMQILAAVQAKQLSPAEAIQKQRDMLRDMIDQQLLLSRGKQLDINVDADVLRQLDDIRKKNGLDSMEALQKMAAQEGVSYEDFKAQLHDQLMTRQVITDDVARHMQPPSQQQEMEYYNAHKDEFQQPEQVGLSEILVPTPENATDAEIAQAQAKAEQAEAELKAGANFADEVKKYSAGPTASQGGEMGVYKRGVLGPVFDDPTFALPVGGVTAPIRTKQGFIIMKVTQHIPAGPVPFKTAEPEIQQAMFQQEMAPALRTYLTKLREEAFIDVAAGFTDSGRSPNQTTVAFEAATPPPPPKTKKPATRFERKSSSADVPSLPPASTNGTALASSKPGKKPKKIKREKIRFGQAPRTSLGPGTTEVVSTPSSEGPGAPVALQGGEAAPAAEPEVNPLLPQAAPEKKTRFAKSEPLHGPKKPKKLSAKEREALVAGPTPMSADEKAQQQAQAQALGVNGDTVKKKKKEPKQKKPKGEPAPAKPRIQERPAPTGPQQPAPTVNPNLGAPIPGQATGSSGSATSPAAK